MGLNFLYEFSFTLYIYLRETSSPIAWAAYHLQSAAATASAVCTKSARAYRIVDVAEMGFDKF